SLGRVLRPEDLPVKEAERKDLVTCRTADNQVTVIFHDDQVVAVFTARDRARSARGVTMHSEVGRAIRRYDDERLELPPVVDVPGGHVEVRRYPRLGIGFESQAGQITGMTLFPPKKP